MQPVLAVLLAVLSSSLTSPLGVHGRVSEGQYGVSRYQKMFPGLQLFPSEMQGDPGVDGPAKLTKEQQEIRDCAIEQLKAYLKEQREVCKRERMAHLRQSYPTIDFDDDDSEEEINRKIKEWIPPRRKTHYEDCSILRGPDSASCITSVSCITSASCITAAPVK